MKILTKSAAVAALAVLSLGATPPTKPLAKGITYRLRMSSRLPAQMAALGGDASGPLILAKATAIGARAPFELLSFQPTPPGISLDDYLLVMDSSRMAFVNPAEKTWTDASSM